MAKKKTIKRPKEKEQITLDVNNVQFWRSVAQDLMPGEDDEWKLGEVALMVQFFAGLLGRNWSKFDSVVSKRPNKARLAFSLILDRKEVPSHIYMHVGGPVDKIDDEADSDVPDPTQTDLPGMEGIEDEEPVDVPVDNEEPTSRA